MQTTALASRCNSALQLPVPPLKQTLDRLVKTMAPLVSAEQLAAAKALNAESAPCLAVGALNCRSFTKEGGVGERLQSLLVQRAQTRRNWLADWWFDYAYLTHCSPVVILSTRSMTIAAPQTALEQQQACHMLAVATLMPPQCWRAAALALGFLQYSELINRGRVPIEYHKAGVVPWLAELTCAGRAAVHGAGLAHLLVLPRSAAHRCPCRVRPPQACRCSRRPGIRSTSRATLPLRTTASFSLSTHTTRARPSRNRAAKYPTDVLAGCSPSRSSSSSCSASCDRWMVKRRGRRPWACLPPSTATLGPRCTRSCRRCDARHMCAGLTGGSTRTTGRACAPSNPPPLCSASTRTGRTRARLA